MGNILAPYGDENFDLVTLTNGINKIPNTYGILQQRGLFSDKSIDTRQVGVEIKNGKLSLIDSKPLGGPAPMKDRDDRNIRFFQVPYYPLADIIYPRDFAGKRAFGTDNQMNTAAQVFAERGANLKRDHSITWEYAKWMALDGVLLDGNGSTIYNWFTEFGITRKVIDFEFTTATFEPETDCRNVVRHIEDNLLGESYNGVHCFAGPEWMDAFIHHPNVEKYWLGHTAALNLAGATGVNPRSNFVFGGIMFEEINAQVPNSSGAMKRFIPIDEARFYPTGTADTFKRYLAPGEFLEAVNTMGMELYMKQAEESMGRWLDVHTESSHLTMCRRPEILVKGTKS